jgi:hypothetical protein
MGDANGESQLVPLIGEQVDDDAAQTRVARVPWLDCVRVFLDFCMTLLLLVVIVADVERHAFKGIMGSSSNKTLHVHEMPIYLKTDMDFGPLWSKAMDTDVEAPDSKLSIFQASVAEECTDEVDPLTSDLMEVPGGLVSQHPMCVCLKGAGSETEAKNCMLSKPFPSVNHDWSTSSFASAMTLWFLASLAMSVGTLPYARTYMTWTDDMKEMEPRPAKNNETLVYKFHNVMVCIFIFVDLCMISLPLVISEIQFPQSREHIVSVMQMMMWSMIALLSLGAYNWKTLVGYFTFHSSEVGPEDRENYADRIHMSSKNWIVYGHFLVAAPAIATILHLTQQWMEYHTIVNTTLIFSAIFAVDGFSSEMANYWLHHTYLSTKVVQTAQKGKPQGTVLPEEVDVKTMHTSLGIMRLFAIVVNAVLLMLLFTLAYPLQVDVDTPNSPIFVIVVVAYACTFLLPDLAREFTSRASFNAIEFRQYGDFVVRALTLLYVWRASVSDRQG